MRFLEWVATLATGIIIGVLFNQQFIMGVGFLQGYFKAKGLG
jgi:hypothetical protein